MKVDKLELTRGYYGDKQLEGAVILKDDLLGEIKVPLTPAGISRLIAAISTEVAGTVKTLVSEVPKALKHAEDEGYLLEHDGEIK